MKQFLLSIAALLLTSSIAFANSFTTTGRVVDIQPVYTQVRQQQPTNVCRNVEVPIYGTVQGGGDAAGGALAGMIIGGILGKGVSGNDNGAAAGAVIGGLIGADKGANGTRRVITGYKTERQCTTEYQYVNTQVVNEYDIMYNIDGREVTFRVNRAQGERAYINQRKTFRIRYQLLN